MMSHKRMGEAMKALVCQSLFGLGFGAAAVLAVGAVEMWDWVAFAACIVVCLVGVAVGVLVADRRGWL